MKIKNLKWEKIAESQWEARTPFGGYRIRKWDEGYDVYITFAGLRKRYYDTLAEAKNDVKEDLRKRILSCIDHGDK